ncbi:MAG TPA: glycosyltransferase family 2 protein [Mycobacteriales bacterium]|nr:glycosyltransferase family 2 protein [Mycobacteriales bacterium]
MGIVGGRVAQEDAQPAQLELSIVMPCLNEAETVATCVRKAHRFLAEHHVAGEVLVADNGSTDGSAGLAAAAGARVVSVPLRGNGAALLGGIQAARGRFVIMGDADDSYNFLDLMPFLAGLRAGADLVMGNRFTGGIAPGAMPALHRYLGNPAFSFLGRLFFGSTVRDFHCGLRGFRRDRFAGLGMVSLGFEFCSEMVIKATFNGWRVVEVPTTLSPDGRSRRPHLRTWRDGFRHLRFFLLYSPRWLFFYPGLLLAGVGLLLGVPTTLAPLPVGGVSLDVDSLVAAAGMVVVGYQMVLFAIFTKVYAGAEGFLPAGRWTRWVSNEFRLERGLAASALLVAAGAVGMVVSVLHWKGVGYGAVDPRRELRIVVPSVTALIVGCQTAAASLFIGILGIRHRTDEVEVVEAELERVRP